MWGIKPRKVDVVEIITDTASGKITENDLKRCCHCGAYWKIVPGSGRPHAHCNHCDDDTCSNPQCMTNCTPLEKRLEEESKFMRLWERTALGG